MKRVSNINAIRDLRKWATETRNRDSREYLELLNRLVEDLRFLPIAEGGPRHPMGFILIGNEWHGVNVLNELKDGWAEWRQDDPNGISSGLVQPGHWAHASADNEPNFPDEAFPELERLAYMRTLDTISPEEIQSATEGGILTNTGGSTCK